MFLAVFGALPSTNFSGGENGLHVEFFAGREDSPPDKASEFFNYNYAHQRKNAIRHG